MEVRKQVDYYKSKGFDLDVGWDANAHCRIWGSTEDKQRGRRAARVFSRDEPRGL